MHHHAPILAAKPHLFLNTFNKQSLSREDGNGSGESPSFPGALASKVRSGVGELPQPRSERVTSVQWESAVPYPAICTVTASGPNRRPAARRRSALATQPFQGLGSSQNKFVTRGKCAAQTSSGPRRESTPWHLGAGGHFAY